MSLVLSAVIYSLTMSMLRVKIEHVQPPVSVSYYNSKFNYSPGRRPSRPEVGVVITISVMCSGERVACDGCLLMAWWN